MHNSKTLKNHRFATIVQILLREKDKKEKIKNREKERKIPRKLYFPLKCKSRGCYAFREQET